MAILWGYAKCNVNMCIHVWIGGSDKFFDAWRWKLYCLVSTGSIKEYVIGYS